MQITADLNKISKTVQPDLTLILNALPEFILPSFQQFFLKRILLVSYKAVFIENEALLLSITMRERAKAFEATI